MTKKKEPAGPKVECDLCKGRGWFYTRSMWPAQCHRCFPNLKRPDSGPPNPAPAERKEYATGETAQREIE